MDDFFRIPKSLCYFMVKHPPLDKNPTSSQSTRKRSKDDDERRDEVGKKSCLSAVDGSKEIPEVKEECLSDDVSADESSKKEETIVSLQKAADHPSTAEELQKNREAKTGSPIDCSLLVEATLDPSVKKRIRRNSPNRKIVKKNMKSSPGIEKSKKVISPTTRCSTKGANDEDSNDVSLNHREKSVVERAESSKPQAPGSFDCETCGRSFPRKSALKVHMVNHSTVKSHKCDICEKLFKRKSALTTHMPLHSGMKFSCEECDYTTTSRVGVRNHVRRMHRKDFNYKCDECEKSFMSNSELKEHKISHLGIKTFICEFCGKRFLQKSSLSAHNRSVHGVILKVFKKDHKCQICGKGFTSEYLLQNHVGIHSRKFLCPLCGKEFANNQGLRLHNRMHTGERPYKCQHCAKSFVSSNARAVHKLTHTGERPYVCDLCGKSFTQRTTMMTHRKKHPGSHPRPPATQLSKLDSKVESNS